MKLNITRRDKIGICLAILYSLIGLFVAGCLDDSGVIFSEKNPIMAFGQALSFTSLPANGGTWLMVIFILVYIPVYAVIVSLIAAYFRAYGQSTKSAKAWGWYIGSFALTLILALGLGTLFQIPYGLTIESYTNVIIYLYQTLLMAVLIFVVVYLFCFAIVGLVRALRRTPAEKREEDRFEDEARNLEEKAEEEKGKEADLNQTFEDVDKTVAQSLGVTGTAQAVVSTAGAVVPAQALAAKEEVFPGLVSIDERYQNYSAFDIGGDSSVTLKQLVEDLQVYLAREYHLFYSLKELSFFTASLAATKLIILEGISGTGKSSLPRYFARFLGEEAFFEPIQVTYKEKSDLLGYFNEFTGKYRETEFLKRLYEADYRPDALNLMVLDEMNISRVEYYFADFLSVMEFPEEERKISLAQLPKDYRGPKLLENGFIALNPNTYFIGTCNKDDSTYTVTDKVIDRALVIDFERYHGEIDTSREVKPIALSYTGLQALFTQAQAEQEYRFSNEDRRKFISLLDFVYAEFGIAVGNRVLVQLDKLLPPYMAMGRKKEEALDIVFATKVLRKLSGRFDSALKSSLNRLEEQLDKLYGTDSFMESKASIQALKRRL